MKKIIFSLLMSFGLSSVAADSGRYRVYLECTRPRPIADNNVNVTLLLRAQSRKGFLRVERSLFTGGTHQDYSIRVRSNPKRIGSPVYYEGRGVRLTVNYSTAPLPDGRRTATLQERSPSGEVITDQLVCRSAR